MTKHNLLLRDRFERFVSPEPNYRWRPGCWLWTGYGDKDGYGRIKVSGKMVRAHRFAWEQVNGPIPAKLQVLHTCDIPACVNPDHLFLGTNADNMADKVAKGRQSSPRGAKNGQAKLTVEKVVEICSAFAAGGVSVLELSEKYGMSKTQIWRIVTGGSWKSVDVITAPRQARRRYSRNENRSAP